MTIITIKDLKVSTLLGVYDWEKENKRDMIFTIEIHASTENASASDDIKDAVDYALIEERILKHVDTSSYNLIEALVADIGRLILALDQRITRVHVEADKPGALRQARSVSVSAEFRRGIS